MDTAFAVLSCQEIEDIENRDTIEGIERFLKKNSPKLLPYFRTSYEFCREYGDCKDIDVAVELGCTRANVGQLRKKLACFLVSASQILHNRLDRVIDVYFEEDDQIVLLDYKTDRVNTETELVDRYKVQLQYYKEAIERITHKTVKDCLIYSFALGTTIQIFC